MSATGFGPTWDDALSPATAGRTWDDALSPAAARLAGRYEAAWKAAPTSARPDPADFLPADPAERPGALLALLRADMTLRWEAGEPVAVEWYHARHPGVDGQVLAALLYEEFCLRTEADQRPDPAEYPARFPAVADQVRRLLDLHCFIEDEVPDSTFPSRPSDELLPEAQQTIAGFYLAEELGRGAFARVFLARERQLADRPVALKVARGGSGEPQTLARLQHTHIVPIFSYRVDPVTKLHLLCMPYFGRATLAHVLAEPGIKAARAGAALVAALERLDPPRAAAPGTSPASAGREALAGRSFPRAIAWWGARLAEALQHAHDRGILHRDIKPSNVLVTGDGMPMLLDFNLAQGTGRDAEDDEPERLGGTLAYMAPEHLEAVAEGVGDRVNNRSDLYALGVVLYEALTGARPFAIPDERRFGPDTLLRLAEHRKFAAPSVRGPRPDLPPELDAVVRRCLAPEPADRYASAAELAVDLQAVADDGPLRFTREPQPSRTLRWLRRNRRRFAAAAAVAAALLTLAAIVSRAREDRLRVRADATKHFLEAMLTLEKAKSTDQKDQYQLAAEQFKWIAELTEGRPELQEIRARASEQSQLAWEVYSLRDRADDLF
ncbi:MAG TPA: serine/threonine-protein kinase, partial [Isosphaeraceae bacterium]